MTRSPEITDEYSVEEYEEVDDDARDVDETAADDETAGATGDAFGEESVVASTRPPFRACRRAAMKAVDGWRRGRTGERKGDNIDGAPKSSTCWSPGETGIILAGVFGPVTKRLGGGAGSHAVRSSFDVKHLDSGRCFGAYRSKNPGANAGFATVTRCGEV